MNATLSYWLNRSLIIFAALVLAGGLTEPRASARADAQITTDTPKPEDEKKPEEKPADSKNGDEDKKPDKDEDEDEEEDEPKDRYFALIGGTVHTLTDGDYQDITILSKNGKIHDMGRGLTLPEDTETLNVAGFHIYPGLIAVSSGSILGSDPPENTTNVFSLQMTIALAGGITTAVTGNTAAKLSYGHTDNMVVKRKIFKSLKYSTRQPDARRKLRASFEKVRQYLRDLEIHREKKKTDPDAEAPDKDWITGQHKTTLDLMQRKTVAVMDANTAHQIVDVCELAQRYGIEVVVRGAVEGWTVAPRMARAGLAAFVTPRRHVSRNEKLNRPNGSSIENAAILHAHGVPLAIIPQIAAITTWGVAGRDLLHLNMEAAFAVRGGLPQEAALRAITIDAARILGIDHRVGSIEIGKDADFVIADGDILHYMTHARWTIVNGRIAYDKQEESLFEHIRKDGDPDAPPPDDYWPKRLGAAR